MKGDDDTMMRPAKIRKPRTMVARKYLCAAPHPSKWDEHAEALLKSLGGPREKREQVLKQTLETLEEMHAGIRKTGPGRKSNAEHAIAFYLYVLEFNENTADNFGEDRTDRKRSNKRRVVPESVDEEEEEEGKEVEEADDDDDVDKEAVDGEVEDEEEDEGEEDDEEGHDNEDEEEQEEERRDEKKSISESSSSMDSKEFLDQHNDQCEVCNLGGQLLCCSTCNLVFHLECVRPSLKELPKDNWSCAYCIASGVVGHSRDSKARRKAKAAVLAMARLSPKKKKQAMSEEESEGESEGSDEEKQQSSGKSEEKEHVESASSGAGDEGKDDKESTESSSSEEEKAKDVSETIPSDEAAVSEEVASKESDEDLIEDPEEEEEEDGKDQSRCDASKESSGEQKTPGKRKLDLFKISDALAPKLTPESTGESRARRPRRQPTLFDPQTGAARKWQSDVSLNWKSRSKSDEPSKDGQAEDDIEEVKSTIKTEEEQADKEEKDDVSPRRAGDAIWCHFCKDDPSVTICCFCACRICFGKLDASKLLLCDNCDDEYHTFCLDPPLDTVPTSRKWFCPSCDPSEKKAKVNNIAGVSRSSSKPSSGGKPSSPTPYGTRSTAAPKKTPPLPSAKLEEIVEKAKEPPVVKIKRPVGRPRKTEAVVVKELVQQPPRKRGRPPKLSKNVVKEEEEKPRKRGRPPKSKIGKEEETPKPSRKRGRPPKSKSPLGANRVTTPSDTVKRPTKKQKMQDGSSHGVNQTRSGGKSSSTPRNEPSRFSGVKGSESKSLSQDGRDITVSPVVGILNAGDSILPSLPGATFAEAASSLLSPQLSAYHGGGQGTDQRENMLQPMSSNSSLTGQHTKTHRSRSGRTVKRSSFHDEIEEGEQHLRSQRYALEMQRRAAATGFDPTVMRPEYEEESCDQSFETHEFIEDNHKQAAITMYAASNPNLKSPPAESIEVIELATADDSFKNTEQPPVAPIATESLINDTALPSASAAVPTEAAAPETHVTATSNPCDFANSQSSLGESAAAPSSVATSAAKAAGARIPRRKPGARECMQISRRFGAKVIPQKYMEILQDYCTRGKVEHLIRMRERLDSHSRFLESQLAGLEALVKEKGELDLVVPPMPGSDKDDKLHPAASIDF